MNKSIVIALATGAAALLATGAAQAGHVNWSIGISLAPVATVISSGPVYGPAYPVYAPAYPVYAPVYASPPVVVYPEAYPVAYPAPYYGRPYHGHRHYRSYGPAPVVYGPPPGPWRQDRGWTQVPRDERRFHH